MVTKEELLSALVIQDAITKYVTVKELLKNPTLWGMKPETLGVRLLRLRRQGLVNKKKFGKEYGYRFTVKGLKRLNYFYEKPKTKREIEQFKRMIDEEYNKFVWQKLLEAKKNEEIHNLMELIKIVSEIVKAS